MKLLPAKLAPLAPALLVLAARAPRAAADQPLGTIKVKSLALTVRR